MNTKILSRDPHEAAQRLIGYRKRDISQNIKNVRDFLEPRWYPLRPKSYINLKLIDPENPALKEFEADKALMQEVQRLNYNPQDRGHFRITKASKRPPHHCVEILPLGYKEIYLLSYTPPYKSDWLPPEGLTEYRKNPEFLKPVPTAEAEQYYDDIRLAIYRELISPEAYLEAKVVTSQPAESPSPAREALPAAQQNALPPAEPKEKGLLAKIKGFLK